MMKRWLSTVIEKLTAIPSRFNNNIEMLRQFEKLLLHICYPNLRGKELLAHVTSFKRT